MTLVNTELTSLEDQFILYWNSIDDNYFQKYQSLISANTYQWNLLVTLSKEFTATRRYLLEFWKQIETISIRNEFSFSAKEFKSDFYFHYNFLIACCLNLAINCHEFSLLPLIWNRFFSTYQKNIPINFLRLDIFVKYQFSFQKHIQFGCAKILIKNLLPIEIIEDQAFYYIVQQAVKDSSFLLDLSFEKKIQGIIHYLLNKDCYDEVLVSSLLVRIGKKQRLKFILEEMQFINNQNDYLFFKKVCLI